MDKILVVIFDDENKAYKGSRTLQDLHNEGNITLYAKAVIAKDASGRVSVKQTDDEGPVGTGVGLLTGSLLGLLVGRWVCGGASAGCSRDAATWPTWGSADFLYEGQYLLPGKAAVVAKSGRRGCCRWIRACRP
jgi:uncharacterized membrane protein